MNQSQFETPVKDSRQVNNAHDNLNNQSDYQNVSRFSDVDHQKVLNTETSYHERMSTSMTQQVKSQNSTRNVGIGNAQINTGGRPPQSRRSNNRKTPNCGAKISSISGGKMVFPPGFFGNYEEKRSRQAVNRFVQGFLNPGPQTGGINIAQKVQIQQTEQQKKTLNLLQSDHLTQNNVDYLQPIQQQSEGLPHSPSFTDTLNPLNKKAQISSINSSLAKNKTDVKIQRQNLQEKSEEHQSIQTVNNLTQNNSINQNNSISQNNNQTTKPRIPRNIRPKVVIQRGNSQQKKNIYIENDKTNQQKHDDNQAFKNQQTNYSQNQNKNLNNLNNFDQQELNSVAFVNNSSSIQTSNKIHQVKPHAINYKKKFMIQSDYVPNTFNTTINTSLNLNHNINSTSNQNKPKGSARKKGTTKDLPFIVNKNKKLSMKSGEMDVSESQDNKDFHIYNFEEQPPSANYEACLKTGNFGGNIDYAESKSDDDEYKYNDTTTQNTSNYQASQMTNQQAINQIRKSSAPSGQHGDIGFRPSVQQQNQPTTSIGGARLPLRKMLGTPQQIDELNLSQPLQGQQNFMLPQAANKI